MLARPKRFELLTPRFVVWCSTRNVQHFWHGAQELNAPLTPTSVSHSVKNDHRLQHRNLLARDFSLDDDGHAAI